MLRIDDLPAPLFPMSSTLRCFCRFVEFMVALSLPHMGLSRRGGEEFGRQWVQSKLATLESLLTTAVASDARACDVTRQRSDAHVRPVVLIRPPAS